MKNPWFICCSHSRKLTKHGERAPEVKTTLHLGLAKVRLKDSSHEFGRRKLGSACGCWPVERWMHRPLLPVNHHHDKHRAWPMLAPAIANDRLHTEV